MVDANGCMYHNAGAGSQGRTMLSQSETIKNLQSDNLALKIQVEHLKNMNNGGNEIDRALVADLKRQNSELKRQLEERNRRGRDGDAKSTQETGCQTNLDRNNIDDLIRAYVEMKKMQDHDKQTEPKSVAPPKQTMPSNKQLKPDEKMLLEKMFMLDGLMTTARDKVRAVSEQQ